MPFGFTRAPPPVVPIREDQEEQPVDPNSPLQIGTTLFSRYNINGRISRGTFGFVYSGEDTFTKQAVALKVMTAKYKNIAIREKSSLTLLNKEENKYVSRLLDFLVLDKYAVGDMGKYALVLPRYEMNLYEQIKKARRERGGEGGLSARSQELVLSDVLNGLRFIHRSGLMHLDLKPENIMYSKINLRPNWTIIDFGNAESKFGLDVYYDAVTPWYRAPEICVGAKYTEKADMWSIGCLIYEMQVGKPLFVAEINSKLIHKYIIELGAPPPAFLSLPLPPRKNQIKYLKVGKEGDVEFVRTRRSDYSEPKSIIGKAEALTLYMYSCLRWMPSERTSSELLYTRLQKEIIEGTVHS